MSLRHRELSDDELRHQANHNRVTRTYLQLIIDLSAALTDEGPDWSDDTIGRLRRRCANALPSGLCPGWLDQYRDPPIIQS